MNQKKLDTFTKTATLMVKSIADLYGEAIGLEKGKGMSGGLTTNTSRKNPKDYKDITLDSVTIIIRPADGASYFGFSKNGQMKKNKKGKT